MITFRQFSEEVYEDGTDEYRNHVEDLTPGQKKKKKSKAVNEAKDPAEYDQEGGMAKNQLKTMIDAAQELHKMMGDNDNLPEWVQSKITKATDYIDSVRDYLKAEK